MGNQRESAFGRHSCFPATDCWHAYHYSQPLHFLVRRLVLGCATWTDPIALLVASPTAPSTVPRSRRQTSKMLRMACASGQIWPARLPIPPRHIMPPTSTTLSAAERLETATTQPPERSQIVLGLHTMGLSLALGTMFRMVQRKLPTTMQSSMWLSADTTARNNIATGTAMTVARRTLAGHVR